MQIDTLSEFLTQAGTDFRLFDLGRRLQPLEQSDFAAIEAGRRPYPWPLQRHAWLAVCYWQQNGGQPYVWFLKIPLDERGLFNNAAVKHFLSALVEQLGGDIHAPLTDEQQQQLADTPFTFQPAQDKLAAFHARLSLALKHAPSAYYQGAVDYLTTPASQHWQQLGLQGLADVAARLHSDTALANTVQQHLWQLPEPVQQALLTQCEHHPLPAPLAKAMIEAVSAEQERQEPNEERIALLLRATAGCAPFKARSAKLSSLMSLQPGQPLLLTMAARLWQDLTDEALLLQYLTLLADQHGELFNGLFAELVSVPALRPLILANLHNPELPAPLKQAFGNLFAATHG
ncbi:DUF3549 family protein [Oceanimonas baumannii]|uniref:Uncharacterized protein DUF3549 n=1 Tax=Oceanimonas baumannii TaxID=129578 RepID=A0A235CQ34_9GAMM|nr:DUF3549 family protein [Oceanimonas baumannii]OYD25965.1 hypothetical protein B6S09_03760 [Oceanimonas baumannii]TDW60014.1 uncharacterized protein DUF3549 [Oceanimonas baumannii]